MPADKKADATDKDKEKESKKKVRISVRICQDDVICFKMLPGSLDSGRHFPFQTAQAAAAKSKRDHEVGKVKGKCCRNLMTEMPW